MTGMIRLIQRLRLKPLYWMIEPLSEFVAWTREELDFRVEARYMERLRRNAQDNAQEYIPAVFWEYTTHSHSHARVFRRSDHPELHAGLGDR